MSWRYCLLGMIGGILISILFLGIMVGEGSGKTITVDDDGEGDYTRIEYAIDEAKHGDVIEVWDGYYDVYETIEINKRITLIGNGSEVTTIKGNNFEDVVLITSPWVNISGFMITNSGSEENDAGVRVLADNCSIQTVNASGNSQGIYLEYSDYSTLSDNNCSGNAENGIICRYSNHMTIIKMCVLKIKVLDWIHALVRIPPSVGIEYWRIEMES